MDMDDDFSNGRCLDLAMLPPRKNADARSDQDGNSFHDMNEGPVHHLLMHLLNSACSTNILDKDCDSSTAQNPLQLPKKKKMKLNTRK